MGSYRLRFRIGFLLTLGVLVPAVTARADAKAPALWNARPQDGPIRVYTDGERAIGGMRQQSSVGELDVTFLGVFKQGQYSGSVLGQRRQNGSAQTVRGNWQLNGTNRSGSVTVQFPGPRGKTETVTVTLELPDSGTLRPLRCGWARGQVNRGANRPLATNDDFAVGDTVTTGAGSAAILVLGDRSVAVLMENTTLVLPAGMYNSGPIERVQLRGGKIWFAVRKLGSGQKFEVETGSAVAAVRGTEFIVEEHANGMAVTMADGTVELTDPVGVQRSVRVQAGNRWQLPAGQRNWPQPQAVDLRPIVDEWNELLTLADYCWPYRREHRDPFWQDQVDPPARRPHGNLDPFELATLVWETDPVRQVKDDDRDDDGRDDDDRGDNHGKRPRRRGNGAAIGAAVGLGLGLGLGHHGDDRHHDDHHGDDHHGDGKGDRGSKGEKGGKSDGGGSILRSLGRHR